jgi:hypothetical protein
VGHQVPVEARLIASACLLTFIGLNTMRVGFVYMVAGNCLSSDRGSVSCGMQKEYAGLKGCFN